MVVIAVVLGVLIGTRNIGVKQDEGLFSVSKILDVSHDANSQGESASEMDFVDFGGEALSLIHI